MPSCNEYGNERVARQIEETSKEIRALEQRESEEFLSSLRHIKTITNRATIEQTIKDQNRLIRDQRARKREASKKARKQMQYQESKGRKFQGMLGEHVAAKLVLNKMGYGDVGFIQPYHGIDGIGRRGDKYVVVEAKITSAGDGRRSLRPTKNHGKQGSREWVKRQLSLMQNRTSSQSEGDNSRIAREVSKALKKGKVERVVIHINTSTLNAIAFQGQKSGSWKPTSMWSLIDS